MSGSSHKPVLYPGSEGSHPPEIQRLLDAALAYFNQADFKAARSEYQLGLSKIKPDAIYDKTAFILGIANCDLATQQYAQALRGYNEVLRLAETHNLPDAMWKAGVNRASVYRRMGNLAAAGEAVRQVEPVIMKTGAPLGLGQAASVARDIDFRRAVRLYRAAILASQLKSTVNIQATLWNLLGHAFLLHGDLPEAEAALTEAFRLRRLQAPKHLQTSYFYLGWLKRRQGDYRSAVHLLERADELAKAPGGLISGAYVQRELARAYLGTGQTQKALESFDAAVRSARELRLIVLPAESFRVSAESDFQTLFAEYIQAGMAESERTGDLNLARKMLAVAEDSRLSVFRSALLSTRQLPAAYIEKLTQYRNALAASLASSSSEGSERVARLRMELADLESGLGLTENENSQQNSEKAASDDALLDLQKKLAPGEALLSFHSAAAGSVVWAITRDSFEAHRIPDGTTLANLVVNFRQAVETRAAGRRSLGIELSRTLFGSLSRNVLSKPDWILSLDGPLFNLPFAALPSSAEPDAPYLGIVHSLRATPTALFQSASASFGAGKAFVGVADPVYNSADPRTKVARKPGLELARLPATKKEIERCSRAWARDEHPMLLTGTQVNRESISSALDRRLAVLHLATHVMPHPAAPDQVMVALGLQESGEAEYLTPAEIATWRKPVGLVTLSGCSSGTGAAYPGLGLFGLTRAWLVSGASAVVASYWPIPDDDGQLFSEMYAELGSHSEGFTAAGVARALQNAQIRMTKTLGWRSDPFYWSAFFVVGKE